jgi:hypothetical protein
MGLDIRLLAVGLKVRPVGQRMRLDVLALTLIAGPVRAGTVAKLMSLDVLSFGPQSLLVVHYSSFRPPDESGVFRTLDA